MRPIPGAQWKNSQDCEKRRYFAGKKVLIWSSEILTRHVHVGEVGEDEVLQAVPAGRQKRQHALLEVEREALAVGQRQRRQVL